MSVDLKAFQQRLNSDPAFRAEFLKDPAKALEAAGLVLPDPAKKRLADLAADLKTKRPPVPGSTLDKDTWDIRVEVKQ